MEVFVKNKRKQGRKGSQPEEDWRGPYDIHSILNNYIKVSINGKVLKNKIVLIHIKPYKSPRIVQEHAQPSDQILLPTAAWNIFAVVSVFPESTTSRGEPQGHSSPLSHHAGVRQQPDMLLSKGLEYITSLPITSVSKECISGILSPHVCRVYNYIYVLHYEHCKILFMFPKHINCF